MLKVETAVASRKSRGGTAPVALRTQIAELGTLIAAAKRGNSKRMAHTAKLWGEPGARKTSSLKVSAKSGRKSKSRRG